MKRIAIAFLSFAIAAVFMTASPFCTVVHATVPSDTVTLTTAQTMALFGQTIEAQYMAYGQNGEYTYNTVTFEQYNTTTLSSTDDHYYSPVGQYFGGRDVVFYRCTASDAVGSNAEWTFNLDPSIDLGDVTYFDTALITIPNNDYIVNNFYSHFNEWEWNGYIGGTSTSFSVLHKGSPDTQEYAYIGYTNQGGQYWTLTPFFYQGTSTTVRPRTCTVCSVGSYPQYYIGIVCPIISQNFDTNPSPDSSSGSGDESSGSGGGSGSGDYSSITNRLDQIIQKLDIIASGQTSRPDYNSRLDDIQSAIDPEYDSSRYDDVGSAADDYMSAQDAIKQDSMFNIDGLDSLDLTYNPKMSDHKIDIAGVLFEQPIVIFMLTTVLALSVISYIIFGKFG